MPCLPVAAHARMLPCWAVSMLHCSPSSRAQPDAAPPCPRPLPSTHPKPLFTPRFRPAASLLRAAPQSRAPSRPPAFNQPALRWLPSAPQHTLWMRRPAAGSVWRRWRAPRTATGCWRPGASASPLACRWVAIYCDYCVLSASALACRCGYCGWSGVVWGGARIYVT